MLPEPKCYVRECRWFVGIKGTEENGDERNYCAAFPDGIPHEIAYGDDPHTEPYEGDRGIQYQQKPVEEE